MSTSIFVLAADQQAVKRAALADQGATSRAIGDDRMEVDGSALQSTSGDRLLACPGDLLTDDAQFMRYVIVSL